MSDEITRKEAAKILRCSEESISRYARLGRLPIARRTVGGQVRFNRSAIEALAASLARGERSATAA